MKIYIGSDHRGFFLKEKIINYFEKNGVSYEDLGNTFFDDKDDYPDFALKVIERVKKDGKGLLLCGSGVGMDITANKAEGIRSCLGLNVKQVTKARQDDDVNVLSLAADYVTEEEAIEMIEAFMATDFVASEKHVRRINKIQNAKVKS